MPMTGTRASKSSWSLCSSSLLIPATATPSVLAMIEMWYGGGVFCFWKKEKNYKCLFIYDTLESPILVSRPYKAFLEFKTDSKL